MRLSLLTGFFCLVAVAAVNGQELTTLYTTITYTDHSQLQQFNHQLSNRGLFSFRQNTKPMMVEDDVRLKIDRLVEKVETILEMYPLKLHFRLVLTASEQEVQKIYRDKYHRQVDYIAYYAPGDGVIYLSVPDIRITVLAHELAHVIIDNHFDVAPSAKIHELLAQFAEAQIRLEEE